MNRRSFLKWVGASMAFLVAPLQVLAVLPRRGPFTVTWRTKELCLQLTMKQFQTINAAMFIGRPAGSLILHDIRWIKSNMQDCQWMSGHVADRSGVSRIAWQARFALAPKPIKVLLDVIPGWTGWGTFETHAREDHNLLLKDALPGSVKVVERI